MNLLRFFVLSGFLASGRWIYLKILHDKQVSRGVWLLCIWNVLHYAD